jgi:C4-dicarboxylate-specific signal transduction histidine kinase
VDFFVNQYNFEQVIINIVDNAIDAGSEQNIENIKIKITASMDKDYSYLEIEDNC